MVKNNVRIGIIGMGMGKFHLRHYLEHPAATVVGIADLARERLDLAAQSAPNASLYQDYETMLKEQRPDLVSVALPNHLHEPVSVAALKAGAHVLCEKPMSTDIESALRMRDAAEATGRNLWINFSQRFSPSAVWAKRLADSGELGELYHGYAKWTRRNGFPGFGGWFGQKAFSGGGPLIDLGVHRIDFMLWLMGKVKPLTVSGATHHQFGIPKAKALGKTFDVEDFATGFVRLDSGASMLFEVSWGGHQVAREEQTLRLMGTKGTIETVPGQDGPETFVCHELAGEPVNSRFEKGDKQPTSYESALESVLHDKPFCTSAEDGIRLQIVLNALYESAARGKEIDIRQFAGEALDYL